MSGDVSIGVAPAPPEPVPHWEPPPRNWRNRVPKVFAAIFTVVAVICALAAISAAMRRGIQPVRSSIDYFFLPAPANLGYAVLMGVLAAAIARRKRIAWWGLVILLSLQLLADLLFGLFIGLYLGNEELKAEIDAEGGIERWEMAAVAVNIVLTLVMLVVLLLSRREFYARARKASFAKALGVFAGLQVLFMTLGFGLVSAFPGSLQGAGARLTYTIGRVLLGGLLFDFRRDGKAPGWVSLVLGLFGAIALLAAVWVLFRSQRARAVLPVADEARIRGLLAGYGEDDSLGYFATRRDKSAIFAPNGRAVVTYRVEFGVSLASADPIGDPEAWDAAIVAWLDHSRRFGWVPAVMGASETGATAYARAGLKVIQLGDEAILYPREFTLDGREMRPVRQAANRIERAGYTARIRRHADIPEAELTEAARLAVAWRDTDAERGFSMALGRLGDPADGRCVLVEAMGPSGQPVALLSFSPWGSKGLSLDLMRRDREADNGLMEFMVAQLMAACGGLRVERVSLNFAVFRAVFEEGARIGAGPILRAWRRLLLFFSRWWQLESLYRSNAKYHPEWIPRYLCFGERRELAKIGIGAAIAEGFLPIAGKHSATLHTGSPEGLHELIPAYLPVAAPVAEVKLPEQMRVRLAKLDAIRAAGTEAYPVTYPVTNTCAELTAEYGDLEPGAMTGRRVALAGRVVLLRDHGKLTFATLRDWSGDIQIMLRGDVLGRWRSDVDLGDWVGVAGEAGKSRRGELSVFADEWTLTAKCLRPLPDKHAGLTDPEARVRQRYVDLIINPEARATLKARSAVIRSLRNTLDDNGFIEVETPMLQAIHGGANARPFTTHINAYDMRLYLRIAPELYLKRLAVGGVERVFELGRTFRNEGVSFKHNPEFTMLEAYQAYADYMTMLDLTRRLIQDACFAARGTLVTANGADLSGDWPVIAVNDAISAALGEEVSPSSTVAELQRLCEAKEIPFDPKWGHGALILEMYERLVEHDTQQPTFYKDFPTDVSPLTRQHRDDPRLAERWDLVAYGTELGTAYSELIDPVEQRRRLTEQSLLAAGGDPEAMELDEDFLTALEYAMPPTGGLGIGVDRIVMLITGGTIRETLPFPLVKPR
ncbi:bifunctional lysylphosphatidylglycerol synthetase/lysine--tRNA ligase LysX [Longispora albida]|uniref:bifunctional lysylphosphatidylglycerol synthetase/lysine--tRNA ligase LysX n=1 Tax=Longispora albida TaxID=203523 RepID=UPI000367F16A|nr:bifunctional lysylphosphatidylglycerol synthetase/lysine--tRNA ligase LysX [Longispora albida]